VLSLAEIFYHLLYFDRKLRNIWIEEKCTWTKVWGKVKRGFQFFSHPPPQAYQRPERTVHGPNPRAGVWVRWVARGCRQLTCKKRWHDPFLRRPCADCHLVKPSEILRENQNRTSSKHGGKKAKILPNNRSGNRLKKGPRRCCPMVCSGAGRTSKGMGAGGQRGAVHKSRRRG